MRIIKYLMFLLLLTSFSKMDTWMPPKIKDYTSDNKTYFARIVPQTIPKNYRKWKEAKQEEKKDFNPSDTTIIQCHAIMYKKTQKGDSLVWRKNLINQVAPVNAFVSNDAKYLVTFDNWHSVGYGFVMAYYDYQGNLLKRYTLEDISPFPINEYSKSVSSIWWRCDSKFLDNKRLEICFIDEKEIKHKRIYNLAEKMFE